jgi:hypothetical protein
MMSWFLTLTVGFRDTEVEVKPAQGVIVGLDVGKITLEV